MEEAGKATKKLSQIWHELEELESARVGLDTVIPLLVKRLNPLAIEPDDTDKDGKDLLPLVELAERIRDVRISISREVDVVNSLLERLQI